MGVGVNFKQMFQKLLPNSTSLAEEAAAVTVNRDTQPWSGKTFVPVYSGRHGQLRAVFRQLSTHHNFLLKQNTEMLVPSIPPNHIHPSQVEEEEKVWHVKRSLQSAWRKIKQVFFPTHNI